MLTLPADPYLALGVSREAQLPEIRSAYRKLVLKCHPDKIQDPLLKQQKQDEFQMVQQAYELLSSETEKSKYDDMYKLNELQKEMNRMSTSSSQPRSSRREREPEYYNGARVYTAEPRASTFASPSKGYAAGTPPSRSYEEFSVPIYDHHPPRKTASWEKRASREEREDKYERKSKKDDKRDREEKARKEDKEKRERKEAERKDKERRKEKEERKEREERERKEKDKKKKVEQQRKKEADFKTQTPKPAPRVSPFQAAYSSSDSESDEPYSAARKTSGTRENIKPVATSERERKYSENMDIATSYLERSGARVSLNNRPAKPQATEQFQTRLGGGIPMAAPTPPPARNGPHAPPPPPPPPPQYEGEDTLHRSSTTKSASRRAEKPTSAKKSTRAASRDPASVEYSRGPPPLQKSNTMPPEYARVHPGRAHTEYSVRPSIATMPRAQTFADSRTEYPRDRSPVRHRRTHYSEDDDDSDDARRHRRSKHRSPERTFRYTVEPGKTSTRQVSHEDIPRQKPSKSTYHTANTSAPRMEPAGTYDTYPSPHSMKVKYAPVYGEDEIAFAHIPHGAAYRQEYVNTY